ncbi:MAG: substrate-binding domain-containing protein [Ignavibacteria bacterium]|nr:substrate-binding domain-containing protein [Ignavibacteria bacterium]
MKITYYIIFIATILYFNIIIQGCDFGEIKQKSVTGETTVYVDENLEPLLNDLKTDFEREYKEAKVNFVVKPAKVILTELINGDIKEVMVARDFNQEESDFIKKKSLEVKRYELAFDGIGFIVNPENPAERLTSDDLKKIFTGEYTKWSQIKVQDEEQNVNVKKKMTARNDEIKVYIQRPNSSTYELVKDSVLYGAEFSQSAKICSTSVQMLESIRKYENSIGIINLAWLTVGRQDILDSTVRALRISKITPSGKQYDFEIFHQGTVAYKKYPYIRKVNYFSTEFAITASEGFVTFLLKPGGQKVFLNKGLVPRTQPVRLIQIE